MISLFVIFFLYIVRSILCTYLILKQLVSCGESRPGPPNPSFYLGPGSLGLSILKKEHSHRKQREKKKETQERRNSRGRTIRKIYAERKILREEQILLPDILQRPLLHILEFNENQTLQVLKAEIAIQDCNFWAWLDLVSRPSELSVIKQIIH